MLQHPIQLNPNDVSSWKNKAYVLSKLGRSFEAKQCLDKATNCPNPDSVTCI
ncbi:MAG: tetratricopeptide repeat protein [Candidatus Nitrosotenuis sp.]